jgi:hypothetical protein
MQLHGLPHTVQCLFQTEELVLALYIWLIAHLSVLYSDDQKFKTFCDDDLIPNLILEKTS